MNNEDIVRAGALALALYNANDDEAAILGPKFMAEMGRLNRLDAAAAMLVMLAEKLLSGQSYVINTNAGRTAARVHSLAAHMGATVTEQDSPWGADHHLLRVDPP
jgi:hypothetical protein